VDTAAGEELWHTPASDLVFDWVPAVVDNKVFFTTDDGYILALDAQTSHERWRFSPEQREENIPDDPECRWCALKFRPPTIADGTIYVASHDKYLYALDASSGAEQWRFHLGALAFYAPLVVDGLVYVGDQDGHIHILDAATGIEQSRYAPGQEVWSIAIEGETLYTAVDNQLVAMNRRTGTEQWRVHHRWSDRDDFTGQLHLDNEHLYLMTMDRLTAVNKTDGSLAWQYKSFHGNIFSEPAVAEGLVVVGDTDSYLYVFEAASGKLVRRYYMVRHDPSSELSFMAEFVFDPAIVDGVIYVGWYDYLYAVRAPNS
jgi:outer membrane protein assembly factor BamB